MPSGYHEFFSREDTAAPTRPNNAHPRISGERLCCAALDPRRTRLRLHAPGPFQSVFISKLVLVDDEGTSGRRGAACWAPARQDRSDQSIPRKEEILGAALLRLTAEAYLLLDPRHGTPRVRWNALLAPHAATERDAWQLGLEDVHAWLPPPIARKFGRRLQRLDWLRDDAWTPYCKKLVSPK